MKHRNEDLLAKLAFGDLEGPEAERVRESLTADPRAAEVYQSYRDLAEGLRRMPVPEHQLSTERLRSALLDQNLKRRSPVTFWNWIWVPAAVGAGAYLATFALKTLPHSNRGSIADSSNYESPLSTAPPKIDMPRRSQDPSFAESAAPSAASAEPSIVFHAKPNGIRRHIPRGELTVASNEIGSRQKHTLISSSSAPKAAMDFAVSMPPTPEDLLSKEVESAVASNALAYVPTDSAVQPIVIIGRETDANTGANRATEVSTVNNVVIGG